MKLFRKNYLDQQSTLRKVFFIYIALFLLLVTIFWNKGVMISITNMHPKFLILFMLSCIIAACSPKIISKNFGIKEEINDEIMLNVNHIKPDELFTLLALFSFGTFLILFNLMLPEIYFELDIIIFALGVILLLLISAFADHVDARQANKVGKPKNKGHKFLYMLRFVLEIPKLLFLFLALDLGMNLGIIFVVIGLGSFFYSLIPRGIFMLDGLILAIFVLFNYHFSEFLVFMLFSRFIGAGFIMLVYFSAKFILDKCMGAT